MNFFVLMTAHLASQDNTYRYNWKGVYKFVTAYKFFARDVLTLQ